MEASPLLKLPPELRIIIYEIALFVPDSVKIDVSGLSDEDGSQPTPLSQMLALTQTCKRVREEALPIFYATNTFAFTTRELSVSNYMHRRNRSDIGLKNWLVRVGDVAAKYVARVEIDLGVWDNDCDNHTPANFQTIVEAYESMFAKYANGVRLTVMVEACFDGMHLSPLRAIELPMFDLPKATRNVEDFGDRNRGAQVTLARDHLLEFIKLRVCHKVEASMS